MVLSIEQKSWGWFQSNLTIFLISLGTLSSAVVNPTLPFLITLFICTILFFTSNYNLTFYFFCWTVFFQNFLLGYVALLGDSSPATFKVLHGYHFVVITFISCFFFLTGKYYKKLPAWLFYSMFALLLLTIYFIWGSMNFGIISSASYLRLFAVPFLMFFCGYSFAFNLTSQKFEYTFKVLYLFFLFSLLVQVFLPNFYDSLFYESEYYVVKSGINNPVEFSFFKKKAFLNIKGLPEIIRGGGVIRSSISAGFFLLILYICFFSKKITYLFLTFFSLLFITSSKGTFLIILLFYFIFTLNQVKKLKLNLILFIILFFYLGVIFFGYQFGNEHIIGFISGAKYFFSIGNGLGFAGNLSPTLLTAWNGEPLTDLGYWTRFQNGSESTFGVLFSSLGILSLLYLVLSFLMLLKIFNKLKNTFFHISLMSLLLFFQGVFQEEAFSPYALGLVLFIAGFYYNKETNGKAAVHEYKE